VEQRAHAQISVPHEGIRREGQAAGIGVSGSAENTRPKRGGVPEDEGDKGPPRRMAMTKPCKDKKVTWTYCRESRRVVVVK